MSPLVARKMLTYVRSQEAQGKPAARTVPEIPPMQLSPRELEVLELLVGDSTEREIAEQLFISEHTVRSHVKRLYRKLHVHSRASAVRVAIEQRLLP